MMAEGSDVSELGGLESYLDAMLEHVRRCDEPLTWNQWQQAAVAVAALYQDAPRRGDSKAYSALRKAVNSAVFVSAPDLDRVRAVAALRDSVPDGAAAVSAAGAERSQDSGAQPVVGAMSTGDTGDFHSLVPLRAATPQGPAVEILGDEMLAVRSEFEADGTETSSVFESRVGQLCNTLEARGASDEGTQFAAPLRAGGEQLLLVGRRTLLEGVPSDRSKFGL